MMLGGQQAWFDHALRVNARKALQQVHMTADWLYTLCTACGWSHEPADLDVSAFRYAVATHECSRPEPVQAAAADDSALVLF